MSNHHHLLIVAFVLFVITPNLSAIANENDSDVKAALEFARQLAADEFDKVVQPFDETMRGALPPPKLKEIWNSLLKQNGRHVRFGEPTTGRIGRYFAVYIPTEFEKSQLKLKIVFDKSHHIAGFFILPANSEEGQSFQPADYDQPKTYTSREVEFGKKPWPVKGILTMPKGKKRVPGVVLVHGSGPHDEDESIGPNKPFRDLAAGLSSRGIAVLRYKKRTFAYQAKLIKKGSITIREEVIEDALAGVEFLRNQTNIDGGQVYVLGHSLGACVAPLMAKEDGKLTGIILLSGTPRDSFTVVLEQLKYIASIPGPEQEANERVFQEAQDLIRKAGKGNADDSANLLGAPISYWKDWNRCADEVKQIMPTLECRLFIAGGGRDYQITKKDFSQYQKLLEKNPKARFEWYDNLNHLYMGGEGKATPAEYDRVGHVERKVIDNLAAWIKKN